MRGRLPKSPETRQRRNRTTTAATFALDENRGNKVPPLPKREKSTERWHPNVLTWWKSVWQSPMASEFLDTEMRGALYLLAELYQRRWTADTTSDLVNVAKEIRLQETRFGLSPIDRRRLQWEIEKAEDAAERSEKRRAKKPDPAKDPRDVLKAV